MSLIDIQVFFESTDYGIQSLNLLGCFNYLFEFIFGNRKVLLSKVDQKNGWVIIRPAERSR